MWKFTNSQLAKVDLTQSSDMEKGKGYWVYVNENGVIVP